jgi:hypothetical protein
VGIVGGVSRVGVVVSLVVGSGCSGSPAQPSPFRFGEPFELRLGARAEFDGDSVFMFEDVPSDSRCPVGALCVSAGEAVVSVMFGARSSPPPPMLRAGVIINGALVDSDGSLVPVPWCTAEPAPINCRLGTSEGKSSVRTGAYAIRLIQLMPAPRAAAPVARGDYVGTFVVSH